MIVVVWYGQLNAVGVHGEIAGLVGELHLLKLVGLVVLVEIEESAAAAARRADQITFGVKRDARGVNLSSRTFFPRFQGSFHRSHRQSQPTKISSTI